MKTPFFLLLSLIFLACNNTNNSNITASVTPKVEIKKAGVKPKINISKTLVLGKFNYRKDTLFVKLPAKYSTKKLYLHNKTAKAFIKMSDSAKKEGINLRVLSGTRSFNEQKGIWERKWRKYNNLTPLDRASKILEYSSMPTTSRHHWGTDVDINNLNNSYFETGKGKKEYQWLVNNASRFGFYQVYTDKSKNRTGYELERWHWTYLPLSKPYLKFYNDSITYKDISGFKGANLAKTKQMIKDYVNGVNPKIK